jgi:arsenite oxidase small subunit
MTSKLTQGRPILSYRRCSGCAAGQPRRRLMLGLLFLPLLAVRPARMLAASDQAVANLAELARPWSAVRFTLPDTDGDPMPCIVIRLPDGGWYASSLICPHNKCDIMYVQDPATARNSFNVDVGTPVLGCPCHFSVFDLLRHGEVIAGPAPGAPLQLKVQIRDDKVFVGR